MADPKLGVSTEADRLEEQARTAAAVRSEQLRQDQAVAQSRAAGVMPEEGDTAGANRPARPDVDPAKVASVMREMRIRGTVISESEAEVIALHDTLVPTSHNLPVVGGPPRADADVSPPGGRYLVGGLMVDAYGREIKEAV